jgi:hypothetical protein
MFNLQHVQITVTPQFFKKLILRTVGTNYKLWKTFALNPN